MTKKTAETLQWIGCILIVSAMLVSRLLIAIPEPVMLGIAIVSCAFMAIGIGRLRILEAKEECGLSPSRSISK